VNATLPLQMVKRTTVCVKVASCVLNRCIIDEVRVSVRPGARAINTQFGIQGPVDHH
jgi:hypothetical protein